MRGLSRSARARLFERQHYAEAHGKDYVSPLGVRDLPKFGRIHRISCVRFGRQIELRSDAQYCVFLQQYFREGVVEIRENVPAFAEETTTIALREKVAHPGGFAKPEVLVTDLVVAIQMDGQVAEEAILSRDIASKPTLEFEATRVLLALYWARRNASLSVRHCDGINSALARNLLWLYPTREQIERVGVTDAQRRVQEILLDEFVRRHHFSAQDVCRAATRRAELPAGASLLAFRQLLASGQLIVDLDVPSLFDLPPCAFTAKVTQA